MKVTRMYQIKGQVQGDKNSLEVAGSDFPIIGAVRSGDIFVPVVEIPQVSDEKWNVVANFQKSCGMK